MRSGTVLALLALLPACSGDLTLTERDGSTPGDGSVPGDGMTDATNPPDDLPDAPTTPIAWWQLPRTGPGAFTLPWPNDLAKNPDGTVDFSYVPNPSSSALVAQYVRQLSGQLEGFSTIGAVYVRFSTAIDTALLPTPTASTQPGSVVQLLDVDPASPERGRRVPLQWYFRERGTRFWPSNTLAVAPVFGFPLRPATRYALVVTTGLRTTSGAALQRDVDLESVLRGVGDEALQRARTLYAPALEALTAAGIQGEQILSMSVFTTHDPTREFFRAADWIREHGPRPELIDLTPSTASDGYLTYRGHYGPSPIFQSGREPYLDPGTGGFVLDSSGTPMVQGTTSIAFTLTIPTGTAPERGWPIAIYAHGTGGNRDSFVRDGTARSVTGGARVAVLGFDQIFHGERATAGVSPETAFFNFVNPQAGRTNNRQAALDLVQCGRFVRTAALSVSVGGTPVTHRFDPNQVMFFGHSQGGLNGPLWLAAEDGARAAVLSGAAGTLALSLILKTEPVDIPTLLRQTLNAEVGEIVSLHPVVTLAQTAADASDPVNYGRFLIREPRPGMHPKHIFQTQGFVDHYAPPEGIASLALSIGLPLGLPTLHPEPAYSLMGQPELTLPVRANLSNNAATGLWMQFDAPTGRDGHFVVFDVAGARDRAAGFLGSAAREGIPTVPTLP